jgi:uncharacterized membrane protein
MSRLVQMEQKLCDNWIQTKTLVSFHYKDLQSIVVLPLWVVWRQIISSTGSRKWSQYFKIIPMSLLQGVYTTKETHNIPSVIILIYFLESHTSINSMTVQGTHRSTGFFIKIPWTFNDSGNNDSRNCKFKVCKSVHHHTIPINQPTRCNNFSSLLFDVYVRLNKFRASSRPPSGAQQLQ